MIGNIHSFETLGTVDGPGIRFVVFMQGCPLRCLYCHNPDTWDMNGAQHSLTPEELLAEVVRYKSFIKSGGVTLTGGEPLMQPEFVREFFRLCKESGIHTALDTSGINISTLALDALDYTDLVLLDIKSINPKKHIQLTGLKGDNPLKFMEELTRRNIPTWVRHVVVPSITDNTDELTALAKYVTQHPNVERVELLPYHTMGAHKYKELGLEYPLEGVDPLSKEAIESAREIFKSQNIRVQ